MNILDLLASSLGRRDEAPNQEMAAQSKAKRIEKVIKKLNKGD